jgi:hypothetical protein
VLILDLAHGVDVLSDHVVGEFVSDDSEIGADLIFRLVSLSAELGNVIPFRQRPTLVSDCETY